MSTATTSTPKKSAGSALRALLSVLLLAGSGAALGYLVARYGMRLPLVDERLRSLGGWDLLVLPLLYLLVIAVHEGGHVLGGLSRGMRFLLFIVGPFQLSSSASGVRFSWVFNLGTLGGVAACMPDPGRPLLPQLRRLVIGGPLASLLLGALALAVAVLAGDRVGAYGLLVAALSLLIFVLTATPFRAGGFMSDGMQLLELQRGGSAVHERSVLTSLMGQSYAGARPAQWDRDLIAQALAFDNPEPLRRVASRYMAFLYRWDRGDLQQAGEHADWIAENLEHYPDGFRQSLTIELALFAALVRGATEDAAGWLKRSRGGVVDGSRRALAEAAVARLEGRSDAANATLQSALKLLNRGMDRGLARLTGEQIAGLQRALQTPPSFESIGPMSQLPAERV